MNLTVLDTLCCPTCKGRLVLEPFLEEGNNVSDAAPMRIVKQGLLLCSHCGTWYPIVSYVPVMLVFATVLHHRFAKEHAERLSKFAGYGMPSRSAHPGEESVQETFTDEWSQVHGDDLSFRYTEADLFELNRNVWLKWAKEVGSQIETVLDVGCGLGTESRVLRKIGGDAEVFGVDLNFSLLKSGETHKFTPGVHFIIASLFHLPFSEGRFDLVYSGGVIHHTFSTKAAFRSIAAYVRPGGHLFVWVYGLDDHLIRRGMVGLVTRVNYAVEGFVRPLISRAPKVVRDLVFNSAAVVIHPIAKSRVRHRALWKLRNTNHDLRDLLSPRFAHRHSYNEVLEWFEELGFSVIDVQSPRAYRTLFEKQLWGVGMTGRRLSGSDEAL